MPTPAPGAPGRTAARIFAVLIGVQLLVGMAWTVQNLGQVPGYGDTTEYLELARSLRVDFYRGIAYPVLLAVANALSPGHHLLDWRGGDAPGVVFLIQLFQVLVCLGGLTYFVRIVVVPAFPALRGDGRAARNGRLGLLLLLLLDPLVAHFNLALLTDALTFSISLVFCTALADYVMGHSRRVVSGALLMASVLAAASLRIEKVYVLAGAAVIAPACWFLIERRRSPKERSVPLGRAFEAASLAVAAGITVMVIHGSVGARSQRMPPGEMVLHMRVIFPHLSAAYDDLPADVRSRISRADAQRYDSHINDARKVMDEVSGGNARVRQALTREIAPVVIRGQWAAIAVDVLKDALENVAATPSFYGRLLLGRVLGPGHERIYEPAQWTYKRLSQFHPFVSRLLFGSTILLMLASAGLIVARRRGAAVRSERGEFTGWVPIGAVIVFNALVFALVSDFVHVRYVLFAHAMLLTLLYGGMISWISGADSGSGAQATPGAGSL